MKFIFHRPKPPALLSEIIFAIVIVAVLYGMLYLAIFGVRT